MRTLSRILPVVVPVIGLGTIGLVTLRHSAPVSRQMERLLLSQLSCLLQTDVTADRITGDVWTGLTLHNLTVSRDTHLPKGALLRVKRLRVRYSGRALLSGAVPLSRGIRDITAIEPIVNIRRDAQGRWNFSHLFPKRHPKARREFTTHIVFRNARVTYQDQVVRTSTGAVFARDLRNVNGEVFVAGEKPVRFRVDGEDRERRIVHPSVVGKVTADGKYAEINGQFHDADVPFFARYLTRMREVQLHSARARGTVRIVWSKAEKPADRLSLCGEVQIRNTEFRHSRLRYPLSNLSGCLAFIDQHILLKEISGNFGHTRATVTGQIVGFQQPVYALAVESPGVDIGELLHAANVQNPSGVRIVSRGLGSARLVVRGGSAYAAVAGEGILPSLTLTHSEFGEVRTVPCRVEGYAQDILRPSFNGQVRIASASWHPAPGKTRLPKLKVGMIQNIHLKAFEVPKHPVVLAECDVEGGSIEDVPFGKMHLKAEYRDGILTVERAEFSLSRGKVETWGRVDLTPQDSVATQSKTVSNTTRFSFAGRLERVHSEGLKSLWKNRLHEVDGVLSGPFEAAGDNQEIQVTGDVKADRLSIVPENTSDKRPIQSVEAGDVAISLRGRVERTETGWKPVMWCRMRTEEGELAVNGNAVTNIPWQRMETAFSFDGARLSVGALRASMMGGTTTATGTVDIEQKTIDARVAATEWSVADLRQSDGGQKWQGVVDCDGSVTGTFENPKFSGHVELLEGQFNGTAVPYARGTIAVRAKEIAIDDSVVHMFGGRCAMRGKCTDIDWERRDARLDLHGHAESMAVSEALCLLHIGNETTGILEGNFDVTGTVRSPYANMQLLARGVEVQNIPMRRVEASASYTDRRLVVESASCLLGDGIVSGRGVIEPDASLRFDFEGEQIAATYGLRLIDSVLPVAGSLTFRGTLVGTVDKPEFIVSVESEPLTVAGCPLGSVEGDFSIERRGLAIPALTVSDREEGVVTLRDGYIPRDPSRPELRMDVDASGLHLQRLLRLASEASKSVEQQGRPVAWLARVQRIAEGVPRSLDGVVSDLALEFRGSNRDPEVSAEFSIPKATLRGQPFPAIVANITWKGDRLYVKNFEASQGDDAKMWMTPGTIVDANGALSVDIESNSVDLKLLEPWMKNVPPIRGTAQVWVRARGTFDAPEVEFSADINRFQIGKLALDRVFANRVAISQDQLSVEREDMWIQKGRQKALVWGDLPFNAATFSIPRDREIDLKVEREDGDLSVVPHFVTAVRNASGRFNLNLSVGGTWNTPQFAGSIDVREGALFLASVDDTPGGATDVKANTKRDTVQPARKAKKAAVAGEVAAPASALRTSVIKDLTAAIVIRPGARPGVSEIGVRQLTGSVAEGTFDVTGNVYLTAEGLLNASQNEYHLSARAERVAFDLQPVLKAVVHMDAEASLQTVPEDGREQIRIHRAALTSSQGGTVTLDPEGGTGRISLRDEWTNRKTFLQSDLHIPLVVNHLNVHIPGLFRCQVANNTKLALVHRPDAETRLNEPTLTGVIRLNYAELLGFGEQRAERKPPVEERTSIPKLDLSVELPHNGRIKTRQLRVEDVTGSMKVRGSFFQPDLQGIVRAQRGVIHFPKSDARLQDSTVEIHTSADPETGRPVTLLQVDAVAEAKVDKYNMRISMNGPVLAGAPNQTFRIDVKTSPPLIGGENAALNKLLGLPLQQPGINGESPDVTKQVYDSLANLFQTFPVFQGIEEAFRTAAGIDIFSVEYDFGEAVNVRVGKEVANGVFLSYRRTISGARIGYSFRVDYRVGSRTVVAFESDERSYRQYNIERTLRF